MLHPFTPETLKSALHLLNKGGVLGFPTETVYGVGGDARQDKACACIFDLKNRPTFNPLIIHGHTLQSFTPHVHWNEKARILAESFWPGPLTLILPRKATSSLSLLATAGLDSVAIRIPQHPLALRLLEAFEAPLAAPSANPSGKISPTQSQHVDQAFPSLFIFDGGDSTIGVESTIIDLISPSPALLRPGGISRESIEAIIGPLRKPLEGPIKAPGLLKSHYAPHLPLRYNILNPSEDEAYLAFGMTPHTGSHVLNLSENGNLEEAASNFFKMLRLLDRPSFKGIAVAPIPLTGFGLALNDRLERAAFERTF